MKIAVTYENGQVFQHFGRTEQFKVYEVEDGRIVSSRVMSTNGTGHEALADFLAGNDITTVICGGVGGGMMQALNIVGIEVCAGVRGDADEAVQAYLNGELESSGVNCSCDHHEEGHECHCGGSCHSSIQGRNVNKTCRVHYRGTLNDGTQFDSSYDRGEPLEFVCGAGMMIRGFDAAVADMEVGQIVDVHLTPDEAYGEADPAMIFPVEIAQLPGSEDLKVGEQVYLYNNMGQPFKVVVTAVENGNITFDANHEMAGKELNFRIELVEVKG